MSSNQLLEVAAFSYMYVSMYELCMYMYVFMYVRMYTSARNRSIELFNPKDVTGNLKLRCFVLKSMTL
jgi:hypothetical protein